MPVSHIEAAEALREISTTERRSSTAYSYKSAAPFLILWGALWFIGYGESYAAPRQTNWIWFGVMVVGSVGSTLLGVRAKPRGAPRFSWPIFFTWLAAISAIASVLAIFYPFNGMQIGSLFPLVIGWSYVIMGVWMGSRFVIAGLAIVALTLFGFFQLSPNLFLLWMAFLGGGILIGTGLWLRSV